MAQHQLLSTGAGFLEQVRVPVTALGAGSQGSIAPCLRCNVNQNFPGEVALASHDSPTVGEDVVITNKESQNLHAELLLHQLAVAFGSDGSTAQGARVVRQFLLNAGIDPGDFVFYDGSGMSGHDSSSRRAPSRSCCNSRRRSHGLPPTSHPFLSAAWMAHWNRASRSRR